MKALEITVDDNGMLRLPSSISFPSRTRLAVLVVEPKDTLNDLGGELISALAQKSGAFDFLNEEPEIYSDKDILPGRENPRFRK